MTQATPTAGLRAETWADDPYGVMKYTLPNGLQVFLSVNPHQPSLSTQIAVRAGSKHDPPDTTGLAHYMEHMLFKGTSRIGSADWASEKELLTEIAELYEKLRKTSLPDERSEIYALIDRKSQAAARFAYPGEYDKLASAIGAKGTNAYTWLEQTVYLNTIPANELERWLALEAERFSQLTLRLFHTELETVYEEFNISQDKDIRKVSNLLHAALFPNHPYGTQTTLGSAAHLRNPSHHNIHHFFDSWYVPNNMAILIAGDLEVEKTIALIEKHWGNKEPKPLPLFHFEEQPDLVGPVQLVALGQESPFLQMGWRLPGSEGDVHLLLALVQHLCYNQQAGLLDLHINQRQLALDTQAWGWYHQDYCAFGFYGKPREGQSLEELEELLLTQLDCLRQGDFPDWLPEAVCNDYRLEELKALESNEARAHHMTNAFILGIPWPAYAGRIQAMARFSKEDIVAFARKYLTRNDYAVVYKRKGDDPDVIKVEKPPITPVDINREGMSSFALDFMSKNSGRLSPRFVAFKDQILEGELAPGIPFHYVKNPDNGLFHLDFIYPLGKRQDPILPVILKYLPYLGTSRRTAAEFQQAFFRLGTSFGTSIGEDRFYISLAGLEQSMEEALGLLEELLAEARPDAEKLANVASDMLLKRENARRDRSYILREAMSSYARYGTRSPLNHRLNRDQLLSLDPDSLTHSIRQFHSYPHTVYYFGNREANAVRQALALRHPVPADRQALPPANPFPSLETRENKVLCYDFPIVQTDLMWISRGSSSFHLHQHFLKDWYNEYFGYGLSSIVFQEIRESKALAYATYAMFTSPRVKDEAHYLQAYVGTQPDKMDDAISCMVELLEDMPRIGPQMDNARLSILKGIESERTPPPAIYRAYQRASDLGQSGDLRQGLYESLEACVGQDLIRFQEEYVKNRNYTLLVLGQLDAMPIARLEEFGPVEVLTPEQVFPD